MSTKRKRVTTCVLNLKNKETGSNGAYLSTHPVYCLCFERQYQNFQGQTRSKESLCCPQSLKIPSCFCPCPLGHRQKQLRIFSDWGQQRAAKKIQFFQNLASPKGGQTLAILQNPLRKTLLFGHRNFAKSSAPMDSENRSRKWFKIPHPLWRQSQNLFNWIALWQNSGSAKLDQNWSR